MEASAAEDEEFESVVESNESEDDPVNPYLEEIMKCPNDWQLTRRKPLPFKSVDEYPFTIVDSKHLLDEMMIKLRTVNEIGFGTKRFTYRSFYGICSLIQIATRSEVFLVDVITLKDDVKVLSEIISSSRVLKVVHAGQEIFSDNLQRDLGIYLVNMFSLPVAWKRCSMKETRALIGNSPYFGALLKQHCNMDFHSFFKEYRSSSEESWDERPMNDGKILCARLEAQYLLHMYDIYRNLLIDLHVLRPVYQVCNRLCKSVWHPQKAAWHPQEYLIFYWRLGEGGGGRKKVELPLSKLQVEVLKVLHDWRFTTALKHDESRAYLLADMAIYRIASTIPKDVEAIRKCISPDEICPLLEEYIDHLLELIVNTVNEMASDPHSNQKVPFSKPNRENKNKVRRQNKKKVRRKKKSVARAKVPFSNAYEKKFVEGGKIPFPNPNEEQSVATTKRKILDKRCPTCGKGAHAPGQTCRPGKMCPACGKGVHAPGQTCAKKMSYEVLDKRCPACGKGAHGRGQTCAKKTSYEVLDNRCPACGKGVHAPGQTCAKRTGYKFFNSGSFGHLMVIS